MHRTLCPLILACVYLACSDAKVFTRCGLTQELVRLNVSRTWVGNWVCLVESESFKSTSAVNPKGRGGKALGIFQINDKDWCRYNSAGGKCNMKCENLIDDNIRDDVACARKAFDELGFKAWDGWVRNCKGREAVTKMPDCPNYNL